MSDIVERLRGWDHCWPAPWLESAVEEAASEIERLTKENAELREYNSTVLDPYATLRAEIERLRAALRQIGDVGFVKAKDAPAMHDEAIRIARAALTQEKPLAPQEQEAMHSALRASVKKVNP